MDTILKDLKSKRANVENNIKSNQRAIEISSERITNLMARLDEYDRAIEILEKDGK